MKICNKTCTRFGAGCGCVDSDGDLKGDACDTCDKNADPTELDTDNDGKCDSCTLSSCVPDPCPTIKDQEGDADSDTVIDCKDACNGDDRVCDADSDGYCTSACTPRISGHVESCPGFDDAENADDDALPDGCDSCPSPATDTDNDGYCTDSGSTCCDLNNSSCTVNVACVKDRCEGVDDRTWVDSRQCCPNDDLADVPDPLTWGGITADWWPTGATNSQCLGRAAELPADDPDCDGVDGKASKAWFVRCNSAAPSGSLGKLTNPYPTLNAALLAYKVATEKPSAIFVATEWDDSGTVKLCEYNEFLDLDSSTRVHIYGAFIHDFSKRLGAKRTKIVAPNYDAPTVRVDLNGTTELQSILLSGFKIESRSTNDANPTAITIRVQGTGLGKLILQDSIARATIGNSLGDTVPQALAGAPGCHGTVYSSFYRCNFENEPGDDAKPVVRADNPSGCASASGNYGGRGCTKSGFTSGQGFYFNAGTGAPSEAGGGVGGGTQASNGSPPKPICANGTFPHSHLNNTGDGCNGINGSNGTKGNLSLFSGSDDQFSSFAWRPATGNIGASGTNGTAGGGGAGGVLPPEFTALAGDPYYSEGAYYSGTSGAAGGLGGAGGTGGSGGGGSFPVVVVDGVSNSLQLDCSALVSDGGGTGQKGGWGGNGGGGGQAQESSFNYNGFSDKGNYNRAGAGGNGGHGGGGGGGAGGNGGHSVCVLFTAMGYDDDFQWGNSKCVRNTTSVPGGGGLGGLGGWHAAPGGGRAATGDTGKSGVGADACSVDTTSSKFHHLTCTGNTAGDY